MIGVVLMRCFVYEFRGVLLPVLIAMALAYLSNPLIGWTEQRWGMPRPATISLLLVFFVLSAILMVAWLGPLLIEQTQTLTRKAPHYLQTVGQRYGIDLNAVAQPLISWTARFQQDPVGVVEGALRPIFAGTGQALGFIGALIGTTTYIGMTAMLIPIYFFVFAWRFERMADRLSPLIPASHREETWDLLHKMDQAVAGFFRGRLLIAIVSGVLYAVAWAWTGVPYWFLLGAGTGLLTIIPYVSAIGWPLAVLLKYLDVADHSGSVMSDWISIALWPSVAYLVVQFIESWWITPWVQGRTNDLSAVTVIIVVLIGGTVAGFLGLLLAIPVAACIKILLQELIVPRWEAWAKRG
jgi:predicted PurR-regulated permease PerM